MTKLKMSVNSAAGSPPCTDRSPVTKQLIIAEKPSVAQDIARALGGFTKEKDFFESEHYVLSSAVGHLLELTLPEEFEVKRGKWSFANLPVIPPHFALKPVEKTEDRLRMLTRLIKRTVYGDISPEEALLNLEEIARNRSPRSGAPPVPAPARPAPTP